MALFGGKRNIPDISETIVSLDGKESDSVVDNKENCNDENGELGGNLEESGVVVEMGGESVSDSRVNAKREIASAYSSDSVEAIIEKEESQLFSELVDELHEDNITDIEWDGYFLWITDLTRGCYVSEKTLEEKYVENLSIRLTNIMHARFNRQNPVLEANTERLRISVWHKSRTGKTTLAIRKIPLEMRFTHDALIKSGYAPEQIVNLLENCITAHMSSVMGGQPAAGKTELLKYLSSYIPDNEKAGVYEDNSEIHYRHIHPGKKCVEFFVDEKFNYSNIIKAGLRHNIDWLLLSESRGPEVLDMLNALSTGAYLMTTIHLDDVRDLPDRMYNMIGSQAVSDRFVNNVFKYIDMAVLVEKDKHEHRTVRQVAFYTREAGVNKCTVIYEDGEFRKDHPIPASVLERFAKYGIEDPFKRVEVK